MIKQSLLRRKPKSDVARTFVGVLSRTKSGKAHTVLVPGSDAKQYHVILRRFSDRITAECRLQNGIGHLACPGNSWTKTVCYHSRAAIDFALAEAGMKAYWCTSEQDQLNLLPAIAGQEITKSAFLSKAVSHQNGAIAYLVVVEVKK
jgi:hypothetical protein